MAFSHATKAQNSLLCQPLIFVNEGHGQRFGGVAKNLHVRFVHNWPITSLLQLLDTPLGGGGAWCETLLSQGLGGLEANLSIRYESLIAYDKHYVYPILVPWQCTGFILHNSFCSSSGRSQNISNCKPGEWELIGVLAPGMGSSSFGLRSNSPSSTE